MASTLKINTLTGVTTAGSIAVTGEGNSTTTNLQQGLCKAWCNLDGTGTIGHLDSFNMSSPTDVGTGAFTLSFTNNMANTSYSTIGSAKESTGGTHASDGVDRILNPSRVVLATSDVKVTAINLSNPLRDCDENAAQICGDLA